MNISKEQSRQRMRELRSLLNTWNPIGVSGLPDDEYDCLAGKLMSHLQAGSSKDAIASSLAEELREHFGLDSEPLQPHEFAAKARQWFDERWKDSRV